MGRAQGFETDSFELYREVASDLCLPLDDNLEPAVRYELYLSKWVYLERLRENGFVRMNQNSNGNEVDFSAEDLVRVQKALCLTKEFIRQMIFDALKQSMKPKTAE